MSLENEPEIEFDLSPETTDAEPALGDEGLETELLLLLSRLELWVEHLREAAGRESVADALEGLSRLLQQICGFSAVPGRPARGAEALAAAWGRARDSHPEVHLLRLAGDRLEVDALVQRHRSWTGERDERRALFSALARGIVRIAGLLLLGISQGFQSAEAAARWQEVMGVFILDLIRALDRVEF